MKVVITGGSYAGKTSIVDAFAEQGCPTVPESGQQVTDELVRRMGIDGMNKFRRGRPLEFLGMVSQRQAELESRIAPNEARPVFLDRCMHDYVAYCRLIGVRPPGDILDMLKARYDLVFLCDTLPHFDQRRETGRTLDRGFSLRWRDSCRQVFHEHGMETIHVMEMPLNDRLSLIREHLNRKQHLADSDAQA